MNEKELIRVAVESRDCQRLAELLENDTLKSAASAYLVDVIENGDEDTGVFLVQNRVSPVADTASPLHMACGKGMVGFVKAIPHVHHFVNSLAVLDDKDDIQVTPFHHALQAYIYFLDRVQRLKVDSPKGLMYVPPPDPKLTSLLVYLVENGADVNYSLIDNDQFTISNLTALHLATRTPCNLSLAQVLLEHGADINIYHLVYKTPYINALVHQPPTGTFPDYLELIRLLLNVGADAEFMNVLLSKWHSYDRQESLYDIHVERLVCLQILLDLPWEDSLLKLGTDGRNFLPMLAKGWWDNHEMVAIVLDKEPKLRSLVNKPADIFAGAILPIFAAAEACNLETAEVLMKHGALPNVLFHSLQIQSVVDTAMRPYITVGNVKYKNTNNQHGLIDLTAHPPNLESLIVEAYNRGFLSREFRRIKHGKPSHTWETEPFTSASLDLVKNVVVILNGREKKELDIEDGNPYLRGIEGYIYFMCHNDLFVTIDINMKKRFTITKWLLALERFKTVSVLINILHCALRELCEGVIELKRLCRRYLRVYLSTEYGKNRKVFDLRVLYRELPLAKSVQEYLMIQPNNMFKTDDIHQIYGHPIVKIKRSLFGSSTPSAPAGSLFPFSSISKFNK